MLFYLLFLYLYLSMCVHYIFCGLLYGGNKVSINQFKLTPAVLNDVYFETLRMIPTLKVILNGLIKCSYVYLEDKITCFFLH